MTASTWTNRLGRRRRGGFTLIETLAAGLILALSGAVLSTAVRQAVRSLALARDYQRAAELIDRTLTKIDLVGPARLSIEGPTGGVFRPPHERFTWQVRIDSRVEGHLYEVTVRVSWLAPGGKMRSAQVQTLLNDPPRSRPENLLWEDL